MHYPQIGFEIKSVLWHFVSWQVLFVLGTTSATVFIREQMFPLQNK